AEQERSQKRDDPQTDDDPILRTPPGGHGCNLLGTTSDLWKAVGAPSGGPYSRSRHGADERIVRRISLRQAFLAHLIDPVRATNKYMRAQANIPRPMGDTW